MKKLSFLFKAVIIALLIASCSTEEEVPGETGATVFTSLERRAAITPENTDNVYDTIGKIHNEILDAYFDAGHNYSTVAEVITEIHSLASSYSSVSLGYIAMASSPVGQIEGIINAPESNLQSIIANSYLTSPAKTSLSNFIDSLLLLQEAEYEDIHPVITDYESLVMTNTFLNEEDKRIILTTTSVARHSLFYRKKRRKDKDWETLVGNIAATIEGASDNAITAASMALATEISQQVTATD